ncbi:hypothetical protein E2986_11621 [Frieseomelitta varia]|uniref:Uncharacterized protein n=1 Tax=Frieseomelitta varia TaxID=561572 RepID=A0A833SAH3_9HYME|nr:hypothetical protein E2986_11621 [Frieseomelitta varia]
MNENTVSEKLNRENSIEGFYANTGILNTGATGFVGKGETDACVSKRRRHFYSYPTEEKPNGGTTISEDHK